MVAAIVGLGGCSRACSGLRGEGDGGFATATLDPSASLETRRSVVSKAFGEEIRRFCSVAPTPNALYGAFAPKGTLDAGGVKLDPGKPFILRNGVIASLRLYDPFDHVIWWNTPPGDQVTEWHVELDSSVRILPYEDLIRDHGKLFGPEVAKLTPGHALADIPHQFRMRCGARDVQLLVNEIVWQGEFVGKVSGVQITPTPDAGAAKAPSK